jgi:hypothetical protein
MRRGFGSGQSPPRALTGAFVCARDQCWSCQQVIRPREHTSPAAVESRQRIAPSRMGPSENRRAIGDVTFPNLMEKAIVSARAKTESACTPSIAAAARRAGPATRQTLEQQTRELDPVALARTSPRRRTSSGHSPLEIRRHSPRPTRGGTWRTGVSGRRWRRSVTPRLRHHEQGQAPVTCQTSDRF